MYAEQCRPQKVAGPAAGPRQCAVSLSVVVASASIIVAGWTNFPVRRLLAQVRPGPARNHFSVPPSAPKRHQMGFRPIDLYQDTTK